MTTDTTSELIGDGSVGRPRQGRVIPLVPLIGGVFACLALGAALVAGAEGTRIPAAVLGAIAIVALALELVRRAGRLMRSAGAPLLGLAGLVALVLAMAVTLGFVTGLVEPLVGVLGAVLSGWLIGGGVASFRELHRGGGTPWQTIAGKSRHDAARQLLAAVAPALFGLVVAMFVVQAVSQGNASMQNGGATNWGVVAFVALTGGIAWWTFRSRGGGVARATPRPTDQVAGHLHDSVLQTLALIQRNASDPARVAQLARQQEHSLRDWLAGREGVVVSDTIAGGIRAAAREVEDEVAGATVEVVAVGDAPLDRRSEMLVQATREAIRNAARHGTLQVRVFVETDQQTTRVYVRDTGHGFSLDTVASDRRGVRDSIIGRMNHVDGTVVIDSGDDGTELELTLPRKPS